MRLVGTRLEKLVADADGRGGGGGGCLKDVAACVDQQHQLLSVQPEQLAQLRALAIGEDTLTARVQPRERAGEDEREAGDVGAVDKRDRAREARRSSKPARHAARSHAGGRDAGPRVGAH